MTTHIMPTYARQTVTFDRGEGAWLWDSNGKRYLDALAGIAVCNLGHAHPAVHQALCKQSQTLIHTSNLYGVKLQAELADKLCRLSGMDNVFFCNSGAEANEAAIKIARKYGHEQGIDAPVILTMDKSFHGRTMGALSATGNTKIKQGFAPLLPGFVHVPYNNIDAIISAIHADKNIVAILVEPVQGEGGVNIPDADYLNRIRALCDEHQLLLMLDEIQTGIGRTGEFLAYQRNQILPDVCTLAKALGNGVPIGACMARGKAAAILTAGNHGSTFGGNPLACSAALAVLDTLCSTDLIADADRKGKRICDAVTRQLEGNPHIVSIRHLGLMIGIELDAPCGELVGKALEQGLLINVTADNTIRLLPPLLIDDAQIDLLTETLSALIKEHNH
ncbi:acetylornithine transaminase [Methylomonas methanica]|uniref:Acetylornithine aminotransferase n=1 Tax=Methylomonas methanica (strain DSM 25384 / MC09) TaxID=857087 RepID=F9ZXF9_METMM|nr:acetylornithine transaminase [Methylomonas methanica]AEG00947.1 Acetylornithine/succinyldiaminopimelate aminotransferase [Methylomonas methanica MC09]